MEYFLISELDEKSVDDIRRIIMNLKHTKKFACNEYQALVDNMLKEIDEYYEKRMRQPERIIWETNKAIKEFKNKPTYENQLKCNNIMNKWTERKELYEKQEKTWWMYLKTIIGIENENGLLPF